MPPVSADAQTMPTVSTLNCLGVPDMPIYDSPHMLAHQVPWSTSAVAMTGSVVALVGVLAAVYPNLHHG